MEQVEQIEQQFSLERLEPALHLAMHGPATGGSGMD